MLFKILDCAVGALVVQVKSIIKIRIKIKTKIEIEIMAILMILTIFYVRLPCPALKRLLIYSLHRRRVIMTSIVVTYKLNRA